MASIESPFTAKPSLHPSQKSGLLGTQGEVYRQTLRRRLGTVGEVAGSDMDASAGLRISEQERLDARRREAVRQLRVAAEKMIEFCPDEATKRDGYIALIDAALARGESVGKYFEKMIELIVHSRSSTFVMAEAERLLQYNEFPQELVRELLLKGGIIASGRCFSAGISAVNLKRRVQQGSVLTDADEKRILDEVDDAKDMSRDIAIRALITLGKLQYSFMRDPREVLERAYVLSNEAGKSHERFNEYVEGMIACEQYEELFAKSKMIDSASYNLYVTLAKRKDIPLSYRKRAFDEINELSVPSTPLEIEELFRWEDYYLTAAELSPQVIPFYPNFLEDVKTIPVKRLRVQACLVWMRICQRAGREVPHGLEELAREGMRAANMDITSKSDLSIRLVQCRYEGGLSIAADVEEWYQEISNLDSLSRCICYKDACSILAEADPLFFQTHLMEAFEENKEWFAKQPSSDSARSSFRHLILGAVKAMRVLSQEHP